MDKLNRRDKIFLDGDNTTESAVNRYLDCRDGIVQVYEYRDGSGYGAKTRLFLCRNTKHESVAIIRQVWNTQTYEWMEEEMVFDSDSFTFLEALITGRENESGGEYSLLRYYNT